MGLANFARGGGGSDSGKKARNGNMSQKPMKAHKVPVSLKKPAKTPEAKQDNTTAKNPATGA